MRLERLTAAVVTGLVCVSTFSQQSLTSAEKRARARWEKKVDAKQPRGRGCFTIEYPSTEWQQVACVEAPANVYGHPAAASDEPGADGRPPGGSPASVGDDDRRQ